MLNVIHMDISMELLKNPTTKRKHVMRFIFIKRNQEVSSQKILSVYMTYACISTYVCMYLHTFTYVCMYLHT